MIYAKPNFIKSRDQLRYNYWREGRRKRRGRGRGEEEEREEGKRRGGERGGKEGRGEGRGWGRRGGGREGREGRKEEREAVVFKCEQTQQHNVEGECNQARIQLVVSS